ncbi:uncharacterized protein C11orf24 homolog isoform X3 [Vombatus ursinus]|uniref:MANSC domain-containing protein n=2 Tax=Vombatus ursinus TaxID=29139 RepID=A0A4X2M395_VOMUR|nr:uncharacterized protein C11orf24 homolog isoform X3 [Vombatus ursinus]XP_027711947.1 uncharacterized protein C11orf24 homolog isoform X3 [Vombatus ursinus]XP_027711948.1 uncharacterized protein C11orf24 homolog isoform X3 [Vombatus ursinus]
MWAPVTFLWLSSLSLSLSQNRLSSLKESQAQVLQIQRVQSQEQCSQTCKDPGMAGHTFCSLSTEEPGRCIVLDCPQMTACQDAGPQDIQELVAEYALEKQNNVTTTEPLLTRAHPGPSPAPPPNTIIRNTREIAQKTPPVSVSAGNHTELGTETLNGTYGSISATPNTSSSLGPATSAATVGSSALTTPQVQRTTEKTSVATRMMASAPSTRVGSASLPVTRNQTDDHADSPSTPAGTTATGPKAGSASSPTVQALPTHSGISPTSSSLVPPKGGSARGSLSPEIPVATSSPAPFSSKASAEAFTSTPSIATGTRAESPTKPEPAPFTARATDRKATPTAAPTTTAQAAETSGTSQNTERAVPQTTLSPAESSPTTLETSARTVTESPYMWIATAPFTQYLVNRNLLLAMLLAGTVFFIAVLVLLTTQAYESYKKKDYTQVDYLINGMYADSEM